MKFAPLVCLVALLSMDLSAQTRDPIAGAWELAAQKNLTTGAVAPSQNPPLHLIYANGHYIQFRADADRRSIDKPTTELTKDELVDRLRMQGQFGTYQVKGSQLMRKIVSAAFPPNNGRETTLEFRVEGDTLITVATNAATKEKTESRYRKLK
jgi:hypothetical protein